MNSRTINGVTIPFDNTWKGIAISLSGGADSALLTYLICNLITEHKIESITVHIISHTRMWKTRPWQSYDSLTVFNWITGRFPNIEFKRHIGFIAPDIEYGSVGPIIKDEYNKIVSGDNAQQRAYAEYICHYNNINAYYNAVTHNPQGIDLGGMPERDIKRTDSNKHLEKMKHMGRWAFHPFRFVEKDWILQQYKNNNIMDLFDRTRSCEGEFTGIDYTTYKKGQYVPICGECFWCKERKWAVDSLVDTK